MESDEEKGSDLSNAMRDVNIVLSKMAKEGYREGLGDGDVGPLLQESFDSGFKEAFVVSKVVTCTRTKLEIVSKFSTGERVKALMDEMEDIEKELRTWMEQEQLDKWIENKVEEGHVDSVEQLRTLWVSEVDRKMPKLKDLDNRVDQLLEETKLNLK